MRAAHIVESTAGHSATLVPQNCVPVVTVRQRSPARDTRLPLWPHRNFAPPEGGLVRRYVLPIAAVLLTAACSSGTPKPTVTAHDPMGKPKGSHSTAPRAGSTPRKVKVAPSRTAKPKPSKDCPAVGDVFVWMKVPGVPDTAQALGGNGYPNCESTFTTIQRTSPNVPGACTEAAWASDNPGYDVDATPAKRLKKVQVSVGPAC